MKKITTFLCLILLAGSVVFTGCNKDDSVVLPTVLLKSGTSYISANSQAAYGDTLRFGITAKSNGSDALVKFTVYANEQKILDSTINSQNFVIDITSKKSILDTEVWKFVITDIAGNEGTNSVTITGSFGQINTHAAITLGAQNNTTIESFLSYSNSTAVKYFQAAAFNHQGDIDMFCFYEYSVDHPNYMTLAAPGSNISGIFSGATAPSNYATKNLTFFEKTTLTAAQFDAVSNDAVILASFDPNPSLKRKKASVLSVGDVYAFLLQSGRYGLLKVTAVTGVEDGSLQMDVKIQK
jgi:hypothetical protein